MTFNAFVYYLTIGNILRFVDLLYNSDKKLQQNNKKFFLLFAGAFRGAKKVISANKAKRLFS